jgi:ATP-dependent DNA helicase RecQ
VGLSPPAQDKGPVTDSHGRSPEEEKALFHRLRALRAQIAKAEKLPPYCIFQDRTLREMAKARPSNAGELLQVVGVGEVTLRKYGRPFLNLLDELTDEK